METYPPSSSREAAGVRVLLNALIDRRASAMRWSSTRACFALHGVQDFVAHTPNQQINVLYRPQTQPPVGYRVHQRDQILDALCNLLCVNLRKDVLRVADRVSPSRKGAGRDWSHSRPERAIASSASRSWFSSRSTSSSNSREVSPYSRSNSSIDIGAGGAITAPRLCREEERRPRHPRDRMASICAPIRSASSRTGSFWRET